MAGSFDDQTIALHLEGLPDARAAVAGSIDFLSILFLILPQQEFQIRGASTLPDHRKDHVVRRDVFHNLHPGGFDGVYRVPELAPMLVLPI